MDTSNAYCGLGSLPGPRPSEGRKITRCSSRVRLAGCRQPSASAMAAYWAIFSACDSSSRPESFGLVVRHGACRPLRLLAASARGTSACPWRGIRPAEMGNAGGAPHGALPHPFSTSDRTRLPAEFKHITKRRK